MARRNAMYASATMTADTRIRLGAPERFAPPLVIIAPTPEPITAPNPSSPYRRFASRVSNTLEATIHPCDTSTMLNRLTHTLNTYSIQPRFMPMTRHSTTRHTTATAIAQVTATRSDEFTAALV